MDQRISFITLAVSDLEVTRGFYLDGLGWEAELYVPGDVLMIRTGQHLILSLWAEPGFEAEVGPIRRGEGIVPITIAHNLRTETEVDEVLALARRAGADPVEPARHRDWGGYSGYFADPDGYRWEIATNPGPTGAIVLPDET
jgi:uncharacterized protein